MMNVLSGAHLEEQKLGDDDVATMSSIGGAEEHDAVHEQARINT